eukprot:TRINITY_DN2309_c0_g2_i1.p1 TRINITY_DN2309_c0_g2~~TRINITY_DN2309_c0_g2_i1.p1  ORF type:complete len:557 (+),score=91.08 TRINITY_DN2309_c0_g2_i1:62-1732(+)
MILLTLTALVSSISLDFDVIVYDATSGGVMSGVAAARHGLSTAVICASWPACYEEGGKIIGGMSANGLGQTDLGSHEDYIGGLAKEFYTRNRRKYNPTTESSNCRLPSTSCNATFNLEPHVAQSIFEEMISESGVHLVYGAHAVSVNKTSTTINSITLSNGDIYQGKVFIDAGYEADLVHLSNTTYTIGRESKHQYNESLAGKTATDSGNEFSAGISPWATDANDTLAHFVSPTDTEEVGQGDSRVQSYNFRLCVTREEGRIPFESLQPENYTKFDWRILIEYINKCNEPGKKCQTGYPSCNLGSIPNNKFDMNNCGAISTDFVGGSWNYPDATWDERKQIWKDHKDYVLGLMYTLSTDPDIPESVREATNKFGYCSDEFVATGGFPPGLYVREARRLVGERVFNQNTPGEQKKSGDIGDLSVGLGGYNFDSHNALRYHCPNKTACYGKGPADVGPSEDYVWLEGDVEIAPGGYQIPFWVTLPKATETTNLLVVAAPSASHVGMSTLRMEPQFMILGHSVGVAAALFVKTSASQVQELNLTTLHTMLMDDKQLLSL